MLALLACAFTLHAACLEIGYPIGREVLLKVVRFPAPDLQTGGELGRSTVEVGGSETVLLLREKFRDERREELRRKSICGQTMRCGCSLPSFLAISFFRALTNCPSVAETLLVSDQCLLFCSQFVACHDDHVVELVGDGVDLATAFLDVEQPTLDLEHTYGESALPAVNTYGGGGSHASRVPG